MTTTSLMIFTVFNHIRQCFYITQQHMPLIVANAYHIIYYLKSILFAVSIETTSKTNFVGTDVMFSIFYFTRIFLEEHDSLYILLLLTSLLVDKCSC